MGGDVMIDSILNFKDIFLNYFNLSKNILPDSISVIILPFIPLILLLVAYKILRKVGI